MVLHSSDMVVSESERGAEDDSDVDLRQIRDETKVCHVYKRAKYLDEEKESEYDHHVYLKTLMDYWYRIH